MNLLKKLPIVTILVVLVVAIKYYPNIMGWLEQKAPSMANNLKGNATTV